jgi:NAD(P)-dependent dehydrogenase (short-subunit alcohol dehydrogenase family)
MPETGAGTGRWVLVAGATGRLGRAVAMELAAEGANIVLLSRSPHVEPELKRFGGELVTVSADVSDEAQLIAARSLLLNQHIDRLDGIVNCTTGYDGRAVQVGDLDGDTYRALVDVDLVGAYLLVRTFLPMLERAEAGRVVLLSSLAGVRGRPGAAHLCAAKAGVVGLTLALAHELSGKNILVNAVAPGPLAGAGHPSGMVVTDSQDVAATVVHLVTPANRAVTGQVVALNGGRP